MAVERSTNQAVNTDKAAYRLAKAIRIGGKKMARNDTRAFKAAAKKRAPSAKPTRERVLQKRTIKSAKISARKAGMQYVRAAAAGLKGDYAASAALAGGGG